jgi:hypothetical protein
MLTSVLIRLGLAIFSALPIERIIAALLNKWIAKIDDKNIDKARKTAGHLAELSALFDDILADHSVGEAELSQLHKAVLEARKDLMAAWAAGAPAKNIQEGLSLGGVRAEYVEPLLVGVEKRGRSGVAGIGYVLPLCLLLGAALVAGGCLTRTRCLQQSFDGCTFNVNEPEATISDNAVPRSLQIGVQDQMVEGGSDSIASGNKTDPSLQVPMGDSALGALGSLIGGAIKGATGTVKTNAANAAAACADGSCSE